MGVFAPTVEYSVTLYKAKNFTDIIRLYRKTIRHLLNHNPDITGLVSTSSSGAIIAAGIMTGKLPRSVNHAHVNKAGSNGHRGAISGLFECGKYIFVDDFIEHGNSLQRCKNELEARHNRIICCAVVCSYEPKKASDMVWSSHGIPVIYAGNQSYMLT